MKNLLIILLFIPITGFSQLSGIPQQDSLLKLADKLFFESGAKETEPYLWVHWQWLQWVNGKKEKHYQISLVKNRERPPFDFSYFEYTEIVTVEPRPINYDLFRRWRNKRNSNK